MKNFFFSIKKLKKNNNPIINSPIKRFFFNFIPLISLNLKLKYFKSCLNLFNLINQQELYFLKAMMLS